MFKKILCSTFLLSTIFNFTYAEEIKRDIVELQERYISGEITEEEKSILRSVWLIQDKTPSEQSDGYLENIDDTQYYIDNSTWKKSIIMTFDDVSKKNNADKLKEYEKMKVLIWEMKMEISEELLKKQNIKNETVHMNYLLWFMFIVAILNSLWITYLILQKK